MRVATVVLFAAAIVMPPILWRLNAVGGLPLALRDRPWVVGGAVIGMALTAAAIALRAGGRARQRVTIVAALASALSSAACFGWLSHAHYALPASSPTVGVGSKLPGVVLTDESGTQIDLSTLRGRPTLLVWFAGSWCPFCRTQLERLAQESPEYAEAVRVLAVTYDPPAELSALRQDLKLPFSILSDPEGVLMRRCELMHCVAVLDPEGTIRWGIVSGNWRDDIPERSLLQAAYALR